MSAASATAASPVPAATGSRLMSGGEALVSALAAHGVDTVFGIPGTHNLPIYSHLTQVGISHFSPRHEQGAGYAADGYARVTGKPGICITTAGPAILNAAAAAAQAYSDSVPVLFISPGMPLHHPALGNGYMHEVKDQSRAMDSIVDYSHRVLGVEQIPLAVAQAFTAMLQGRPRPVHLEIPLDLLDALAEVVPVPPLPLTVPLPDPAALGQAAAVLSGASRPGIIVGGGGRGAASGLIALAERLGAPVITTTNGKGSFPDAHELALGAGVHLPGVSRFAADCDVVLAIGTELAPSDLWNGPLPLPGTLVRIDIDARSIMTNAVPQRALLGDAAGIIAALLPLLEGPAAPGAAERAALWRGRIRAEAREEGHLYLPIVEAMARSLGPEGIVGADSAMACYYGALSNLPAQRPASFLYPTGCGTLGFGLPAAIGAKLGRPDARVMAMHGDGGVMFSIAELAAAAEAGLALPLLVIDNGGYGEIRNQQFDRGDTALGVDLGRVDFPALARAMGCHGVATTPEGLTAALDAAFDADRPTLIHVMEPDGGTAG